MKAFYLVIVFVGLMTFCSTVVAGEPEWAKPERRIEGGDIIQVGVAEDYDRDLSIFRAKQTAIKAIVESCNGVAHRNIVIEKTQTDYNGIGFRSFAQVFLHQADCEYVKAHKHDKTMENPEIRRDLDTYNKSLDTKALGDYRDKEKYKAEVMKEVADYVRNEQSSMINTLGAMQEEMEHTRNALILEKRKVSGKHVRKPTQSEVNSCRKRLNAAADARDKYVENYENRTGKTMWVLEHEEHDAKLEKLQAVVDKISNECMEYERMAMFGDAYIPANGFTPPNYEQ